MHIQIIDTKKLNIYISDQEVYELTPKIFIDFFIAKANLKRMWRDNNIFYFDIGLFGYRFALRFMWNFVERKRNKREEEMYQDVQEFLKDMQDLKKVDETGN